MKRLFFLLAPALALLAVRDSAAGSSAGAEPFNFLFLDADARAVGLGGAYTALATDSNALLYNPAGLGRLQGHEASFMHNQHFQGVTQEYVGFAARQGWGASLNYLNSGAIPRTTLSNPDGAGLGSVGLTDMALGAGYGRAVGEELALGAGVKLVRESAAGVTAQGWAADFGALYSVAAVQGLVLGAAAQNIGPPVKFQSSKENLPLNMRAGAAYFFPAFGHDSVVSLDVSKERSEGALAAVGVESIVAGRVPLRLGFSTRNDAGPGVTAGIGWRSGNLLFDYAFVPYGELGMAHRVSVAFRWGEAEGS